MADAEVFDLSTHCYTFLDLNNVEIF